MSEYGYEYWGVWAEFLRSDPGHPLGHGMPTGEPLRVDGDSHRVGWMRVVRNDPCSYCSRPVGGTVDHVEAQRAKGNRLRNDLHTWLNFTGACAACNTSKRTEPLLSWLARRRVLVRD